MSQFWASVLVLPLEFLYITWGKLLHLSALSFPEREREVMAVPAEWTRCVAR